MPSFGYNFAGYGAVTATSITTTSLTATGTVQADKFRAAEKSGVDVAYGFVTGDNYGFYKSSVYPSISIGGAQAFAVGADGVYSGTAIPIQSLGAFNLAADVAASIGADQNDYAPTGGATSAVWRITPTTASRTLTGISGGGDGRVLIVMNPTTGALNLVIANDSASSTAANRVLTPAGLGLTIVPGGAALLIYDSANTRWRGYPLF